LDRATLTQQCRQQTGCNNNGLLKIPIS